MAKTMDSRTNTTTKKTAAAPSTDSNGKRRHMIAEAAYFRAQRRDFRGGNPIEDWLTAEREIDTMLRSERPSASAR
jgi:hypothetical protein